MRQRHAASAGTAPKPRRGVILLAVLIALVVLSLAGYQYADMMLSEYRAAANAHRAVQARVIADSGIHYAAAILSSPDNINSILGGNTYDNAPYFRDIVIPTSDGSGKFGKFTLIAPRDENDQQSSVGPRFGVIDEAAKLNINVLMQLDPTGTRLYNALMALPPGPNGTTMTADLANSIVDWLDSDFTARDGGAEDDYYMGLNPPYHAKNGPLESLEELLLVKGMTPQILFGNDLNRNGIIDPEEDDGSGPSALGLAAYLTIYSREANIDPQGNPLNNLNTSDLQTLFTNLSVQVDPDLATFIILARQYGISSTTGGSSTAPGGTAGASGANSMSSSSGTGSATSPLKTSSTTGTSGDNDADDKSSSSSSGNKSGTNNNSGMGSQSGQTADLGSVTLDFTKSGKTQLKSIWQLVNAQVSVPASNTNGGNTTTPTNNQPTIYASPLNDPNNQATLLPLLFSTSTLAQSNETPARVNVNTAPQEVLATIPELQQTDIENIMTNRPQVSSGEAPDPIFQTPAWLLLKTNPPLDLNTLQQLDPYITTRSQVYRVQSVGYIDDNGPAARIEAIIDTNGGRPRIIAWRDLTVLGKGWSSGQ